MTAVPGRERFSRSEWKLIESLPTPARVQRFLTSLPYNRELDGSTLRSFREALKRNEVHCLEAALVAAVILEQHGFPTRLLSLESQDKLDHVIFVFRENSCWGSIGRSRDIGLHGRRPVFRRLRDLAWSYFAPYVDYSGRITGYGLGNLDALEKYDWRFSAKNVWKVENYLREIPHCSLKSSDETYGNLLTRFKKFKKRHPDKSPAYYDNRRLWML